MRHQALRQLLVQFIVLGVEKLQIPSPTALIPKTKAFKPQTLNPFPIHPTHPVDKNRIGPGNPIPVDSGSTVAARRGSRRHRHAERAWAKAES